jgi:hypothetical protein
MTKEGSVIPLVGCSGFQTFFVIFNFRFRGIMKQVENPVQLHTCEPLTVINKN